jgi:predicted ATPase
LEEIAALLTDALPSASETMPFAELIWQKTEGNPFFVAQFLTLIHLERLIVFEHASGKWVWDLTAISTRGFTDNVISLMTRKLARLPSLAQQTLAMASYMGNIFDVRKIALVTGHDEGELLDAMRVVQHEGLIAFAEGSADSHADDAQEAAQAYRFSHDRVQQAANALIPQDARKATRLRIGKALLENLPPARLGMVPFEILDNLNEGAELVESPIFREQIARLNLQAGRRARESAAFAAAIDYFRAGMSLLQPDCWTAQYELARDLYLERFECAYVTGRIEEANTLFDAVISHLATRIEKAQAYYTKILLSTGVDRLQHQEV